MVSWEKKELFHFFFFWNLSHLGRVSRLVQPFRGQISGLTIEQKEESKEQCVRDCQQYLDLPDVQTQSNVVRLKQTKSNKKNKLSNLDIFISLGIHNQCKSIVMDRSNWFNRILWRSFETSRLSKHIGTIGSTWSTNSFNSNNNEMLRRKFYV